MMMIAHIYWALPICEALYKYYLMFSYNKTSYVGTIMLIPIFDKG